MLKLNNVKSKASFRFIALINYQINGISTIRLISEDRRNSDLLLRPGEIGGGYFWKYDSSPSRPY